jgi:hypothetical protein
VFELLHEGGFDFGVIDQWTDPHYGDVSAGTASNLYITSCFFTTFTAACLSISYCNWSAGARYSV